MAGRGQPAGPAGYRLYGEADAERVRFIAAAKQHGLSLDQIRDLLQVWDGGMCREIRDELRPMIGQQIAHANQRIGDLRLFRDQLTAALGHLRRLPAKDGPCDSACEFLHVQRSGRPTAVRKSAHGNPPPPPDPPAHSVEVPVACSLDPAGYRDRAADWRRLLAGAERTHLSGGGMLVRLPAERAAGLAALAVAEQECCPFFTFRITLAGTYVELEAHAPGSAESLVAALFAETDDSSC